MSVRKKTDRLARRIVERIQDGTADHTMVTNMLDSLVKNRDKRIAQLERRNKPRVFTMTQKIITGALRDCIRNHGPITKEWIGSAAKRIYINCIRVDEQKLAEEQKDTVQNG